MMQTTSRPGEMPGTAWRGGLLALTICVLLLAASSALMAQDKYLVTTQDGQASLYDLATNTFIEANKGSLGFGYPFSGSGWGTPVPGPNDRLAFVVSGHYIAVLDLTINREVARIRDVPFPALTERPSAALTPSRELLLVARYGATGGSSAPLLSVVDTARLKVIGQVNLSAAFSGPPGAIVALNSRAYVFPSRVLAGEKAAVVDLSKFGVSRIALPAGTFTGRIPVGWVPEQGAIVMFENERADNKSHVVLISTSSDSIVADVAQSNRYTSQALAVSPAHGNPFAYITANGGQGSVAYAIDLRSNSPTYAQVLTATAVQLGSFQPSGMAVSSDGSELVVAGVPGLPQSPNVVVIDTGKMFSDPAQAVTAQLQIDNGMAANDVCIAGFLTTKPNTAPQVTAVSGDITNDAERQLQITGGNFLPGAVVRLGSMDRLPAELAGANSLTVTVPKNAPAGRGLDVVVTNPQVNDAIEQQNQSGVLAGGLNVLPNPQFQPKTQLATANGDGSFSVYDLAQGSMTNVQSGQANHILFWPAFNIDGKQLYFAGGQVSSDSNVVMPVNLANNVPGADIAVPGTYVSFPQTLAATRDPQSGKPVVVIAWADTDPQHYDLHVGVIDSDAASPTFNTFVKTFDAGLNTNTSPMVMTASPDGKFAYVWYYDQTGGQLGIVNLMTGQFTVVSPSSLGVLEFQQYISVTPDSKYLLLQNYWNSRGRIKVFDVSTPTKPKRLIEITPIPISGRGFPYITAYRVAGEQLYAFDPTGLVMVYNFRPSAGDFRERGYAIVPNLTFQSNFGFSVDGAYLYVADAENEQVVVLDTAKLKTGKDVLLTNLRAPYYPFAVDVSRAAPSVVNGKAGKPEARRREMPVRPAPGRSGAAKHSAQ
jgi:hypothetical protein